MDFPEILAPAGDREALAAALAAGADAVYFGLDEGFNARARAANFPLDQLEALVDRIHFAGARAYLTLNTLVFESELQAVERIVHEAARVGVDALIVQDPAVALLARQICPELPLHASTQMTVSSPEAAAFAQGLGVRRVVLPRELSLEEIERFRGACDLETEVFIAGALCVSWSGQCLSSEAWGGRSANRGQCAQACRLPYDLMVDGEHRPLGEVAYLLSPHDLAGTEAVETLARLGVRTLKIEGRQKSPEYVYQAVTSVRAWLEGQRDLRDLSLTYSRGFGPGFFAGSDHQSLVDGTSPRHRGLELGRVVRVEGKQVFVEPSSDLTPEAGMGIVFQSGLSQEEEQGGPIFAVARAGRQWRLGFGIPGPDLARVQPGDSIWVSSDPQLDRRLRQALKSSPEGRLPLELRVLGRAGEPLEARARCGRAEASARSASLLEPARGGGLDPATLTDKLAALGGTPYRIQSLDCAGLEDGLFVPVSQLKAMRRELLEQLTERLPSTWRRRPVSLSPTDRPVPGPVNPTSRDPQPVRLVPLCRTDEQLEAVLESGLPEVALDWMERVGLARAVARARQGGLRIGIATVRVQKPGEEGYDRRVAALEPDFVLVRHWAGLMHFSRLQGERPGVEGDFSLNVTNSVTAHHLLGLGLDSVTAAHDLDRLQLLRLLDHFPADRLAVTVHHHIPTFHTEHCVYSHLLSEGRDYHTCGRPCEQHQVGLRDRKGIVHPVVVDVGCRNTVFNGAAQSAAGLVPELVERGVRTLRIEFVRESKEEASAVLRAYRDLLDGRATPAEVLERIGVHEQFGVSLGTMQVIG